LPINNIYIIENFLAYANKIKNCKSINPAEKLILFTLYSYKNKKLKQKLLDILVTDTSLPSSEVKKSLYCLLNRGWLQIKNNTCKIQQPEMLEKGQKIALIWSDIFGSLQLTPYSFKKIITYIDDGMEEELIIEVLKISADKAQGNPHNYINTILTNFLNKKIYTLEDHYNHQEERGEDLGKQVSTGTKKNKKGMERQTLSELYKKGYQ